MLLEDSPETRTPDHEERSSWVSRVLVPQMWGAVTISVMWLAVLFVGVFGPNIVTHDVSGSSGTWPVVIFVALFAFLATVPVAKWAFRSRRD